MVRPMSFLLALWLATLFVAGQNTHVPAWLVWLDGLAAVMLFVFGCVAPMLSNRARVFISVGLSLGVLALWAGGLATHVTRWLTWGNFFGVIWYLGVVVAEQLWAPRTRGTMRPGDSSLVTDN